MATISIDGVDYDVDQLSDQAKATLASIQFVRAELQRLEAQAAVLRTAETAYARSLKEQLPG